MAETLLLAHTVGRKGWEVAHAGGSAEFALAAVGHCFVHRRLLFNLPLLWRLRKLWHAGVTSSIRAHCGWPWLWTSACASPVRGSTSRSPRRRTERRSR